MKYIPSILAVLILGVTARSDSAIADFTNRGQVLTATGGRFVFGQVSEQRADQFMLDTQTGMLWQKVKDKDGSYLLQPVWYLDEFDHKSLSPSDKPRIPAHYDPMIKQ